MRCDSRVLGGITLLGRNVIYAGKIVRKNDQKLIEIATPTFGRLAMTEKCQARTLAYLSSYLQAFVAVFLLMRRLLAICP